MLPQRPGDDPNRYGLLAGNRLPPLTSGTSPRGLPPPSPGAVSGFHEMGFWDRDKAPSRGQWSPSHSSASRGSARLPPLMPDPSQGWQPYMPSSPHHHVPTPMTSLPHRDQSPTSPATTSGASPGGRIHSPDGGSKKKKRRVALSCAECAKRKQKCNRETPCQHCVQRRVPELCVPYTREGSPPPRSRPPIKAESVVLTAPVRPPSQLPTLTVRVSRIEALLNAVVNRVDGVEGKALHDWRINHAPASSPPPISRSRIFSSKSSVNPDQDHFTDRENSVEEVIKIDQESLTRNPLPQQMSQQPVHRTLDFHGTAQEAFERGMRDNGIHSSFVHGLIAELPDRARADKLVDHFFTKFNSVRYPIDEPSFRSCYDWLYQNLQQLNPKSLLFLPVPCIVLAIATRIAPDDLGMDEEAKKRESHKLYLNSRSAMFVARTITPETVQLVETRMLLGLFLILMSDRRLSEGWAEMRGAITSAQVIGLHRDGSKLQCDAYTTEYRRRLWSYLLHADATYSCLLGRPTCIDLNTSDTLFPSNIDMRNMQGLKNLKPNEIPSKPMHESTFATYLILRRQLGEIVGEIARLFSRISKPIHYDEIKEIDGLFTQFIASLPPDFRMYNPNKSHDTGSRFLPIHRYYIQTEILHFRIILHRPYFLRKLRSSKYALSRSACFDSAVLDFNIRNAFKKDVPDFFETLLGGSFREFNVGMIAGISQILDPRHRHAADMKAIIQSFLDRYPHDESSDHFSEKEAGIIHTLHRRAVEAEERRASRPHSSDARISALRGFSAERDQPRRDEHQDGIPDAEPTWKSANPFSSISFGSDDETDQPQLLLNHWLATNQQVNPPLSFPSADMYNAGYPVDMGPQDGVLAGWMEPTVLQTIDPMSVNMPPVAPVPTAPYLGDGNNVQFWDKMIDGIQTAQNSTSYQLLPSA